jgi:hypothetical protein
MSSALAGTKRTPAKASASATKSGWREPAVGWGTHLQVICDKPQTSFDGPSTRRADARRSWMCVRRLPNSAQLSQQRVRIAHHGGLTPAALGCVFASRQTLLDSRSNAFVSHTTAGSRPPLLRTLVCALHIAHFSPNLRRATRAAGVSQPCDEQGTRGYETHTGKSIRVCDQERLA